MPDGINVDGAEIALSLFNSVPKIITLNAPPPNWIWPAILAEGNFHMFSGEPGSMKSYFAMQMAIGIAQGELFGVSTTPRKVIYVDKENPANMVKQRALGLGLKNEENLCYWGLWSNDPPPNIEHPIYKTLAKGLKPVMIFDSLIRYHNADEDKSGEMAEVSECFRVLCTAGATVLVLHHKGKPQFNGAAAPYRGSSEIAGGCDIAASVSKKDENGQLMFTIKAFKNRHEEETELRFIFNKTLKRFEPVDGPALGEDEKNVLNAIEAMPGKSVKEICIMTSLGETKLRAILKTWLNILWEEREGPMKKVLYFPRLKDETKG